MGLASWHEAVGYEKALAIMCVIGDYTSVFVFHGRRKTNRQWKHGWSVICQIIKASFVDHNTFRSREVLVTIGWKYVLSDLERIVTYINIIWTFSQLDLLFFNIFFSQNSWSKISTVYALDLEGHDLSPSIDITYFTFYYLIFVFIKNVTLLKNF